jgi:hypothetical protein
MNAMSIRGPEEGAIGGRGGWEKREHDDVMGALERALSKVPFPATKSAIAEFAGGEKVADDVSVPLLKYIEALPNQRYRDAAEVRETLEGHWQETRGLRGAGYGASEEGGAKQ